MRIFLYEFITGGGMLSVAPHEAPSGSLLAEGAAMCSALAEDLVGLPDTHVVTTRDARIAIAAKSGVEYRRVHSAEDASSQFDQLAADADWTIVIAPEFDRHLLDRTLRVEQLGGRLLGPPSSIVALATYKDDTLAHLRQQGIRTPVGGRLDAGDPLPASLCFPTVLKPRDGAGSQGVQRIDRRELLPALSEGSFLLEQLQPGMAASVAVLCGPHGQFALPACRQILADDGSFAYLGGKLPLDEPLQSRAAQLALRAVHTLPACLGYIGIDMVLGASAELDTVIEINPRLTTSYVGLRRLARGNLAAAMLEVACGATPDLCFRSGPVEFASDGTILQN